MNIELSVKEENGVVKIKITSPDKPVVIEMGASTNVADTPVTKATIQKETASSTKGAANMDVAADAETTALAAKLAAMNREYERVKKAAYRAGKRLEKNLKALGQTMNVSATGSPGLALAGVPCSVPRVPEACPQTVLNVPNTVPGDTWGQGQAVTTYNSTNTNTKTVIHNHVFDNDSDNVIGHTMSDQVMSHEASTAINALSPKLTGNRLPFVPEDTPRRFIPLASLPEMYQNLLQAWNQLPLPKKLKGLYPDMMEKLHTLLQQFGEAPLHKAIRMVADSPFLLGKSPNSSGWVIYFGWLLKPGNLIKILENKYRDRNQEYECVTYPEYIPWSTVKNEVNHATVTANAYAESPEATADYCDPVPDECSTDNAAQGYFLDPEYMLKGLDPLTEEARSNLARAAALLGLTKTPAA